MRGEGLIAAVELVNDKSAKTVSGPVGALGTAMSGILLRNGLIARNIGDAIGLCPPMIITQAQVEEFVGIFHQSLDELARA